MMLKRNNMHWIHFFAVLSCNKSVVRTTSYSMKRYHTSCIEYIGRQLFICHAKQTTKDCIQLLNKAFCQEKHKERKTKQTKYNKQLKNIYMDIILKLPYSLFPPQYTSLLVNRNVKWVLFKPVTIITSHGFMYPSVILLFLNLLLTDFYYY